ncbi:MAG: ABC transporter ATP-binding protein [Omnitrophica bacterium RIFCSPHIGHO2_02_FULL_63_14]|nr:MAG: ABC transporter ATP-binding protein [Omnitrophica bacterium RIFCSPHIGHO2_02_FULL_63_14]
MAQTRQPIISIRNLTKNFGPRRILDGVNLDIYEGETLVIMGGSGCGKSTLLRHLIGSIRPDTGEVWMFGRDIAKATEDEMDEIRKKFGMLFQSGALFDSMTVGENIALPLREHTKLDDNIIQIVIRMKLELVGLRGFERLMPSQLSGGMKKRVGLARAIVMDPRIVFYDEPTAGLDPVMTGVVDKLTIDLTKKLQITSVVVTHDMNSVFRIADRIIMLHMGKIVETGTPDEIRRSQNPLIRQFVAGSAEGPISFFQQGEDYLEHLTAEIKE